MVFTEGLKLNYSENYPRKKLIDVKLAFVTGRDLF